MTTRRRAAVIALSFLAIPACGSAPDEGDATGEELTVRCGFHAGALPRSTLKDLPAKIPIKHVIVVMQENRSFDHILGSLARTRGDVDGIPPTFVNYDKKGKPVHFTHRTDTCFEADSPHDEEAMESAIDGEKMDDFVKAAANGDSDGHYVMSYYTSRELPFYYFLAKIGRAHV